MGGEGRGGGGDRLVGMVVVMVGVGGGQSEDVLSTYTITSRNRRR